MTLKNDTICIKTSAFYALLNEVIAHIDEKYHLPKQSNWVDGETAMSLLNITSRTTLQNIRDDGKIRFSKTSPKNIMYDRESIIKYIEDNAQETF